MFEHIILFKTEINKSCDYYSLHQKLLFQKYERLMNTSSITQAWNKHLLFIIAQACTTKIAINGTRICYKWLKDGVFAMFLNAKIIWKAFSIFWNRKFE